MTDPRDEIDRDDPTWLPEMLTLDSCDGDYAGWIEALHDVYQRDLVRDPVVWRGYRVATQRHPESLGKPYLFWHLTDAAEGHERLPDLRRSERLPWIRAVLTAPDDSVRTWIQDRTDRRLSIGIALPNFSYALFLRPWPDRVQLMTAYHVASRAKRLDYARQWGAGHAFDIEEAVAKHQAAEAARKGR